MLNPALLQDLRGRLSACDVDDLGTLALLVDRANATLRMPAPGSSSPQPIRPGMHGVLAVIWVLPGAEARRREGIAGHLDAALEILDDALSDLTEDEYAELAAALPLLGVRASLAVNLVLGTLQALVLDRQRATRRVGRWLKGLALGVELRP